MSDVSVRLIIAQLRSRRPADLPPPSGEWWEQVIRLAALPRVGDYVRRADIYYRVEAVPLVDTTLGPGPEVEVWVQRSVSSR